MPHLFCGLPVPDPRDRVFGCPPSPGTRYGWTGVASPPPWRGAVGESRSSQGRGRPTGSADVGSSCDPPARGFLSGRSLHTAAGRVRALGTGRLACHSTLSEAQRSLLLAAVTPIDSCAMPRRKYYSGTLRHSLLIAKYSLVLRKCICTARVS